LGTYQEDPPVSVWNAISAGLENRRRRGMIIIALAAAASLALAVTLGINYFGSHVRPDEGMAGAMLQPTHLPSPETKADAETVPGDPVPVPERPSRPVHRENMENSVVQALTGLSAKTAAAEVPLLAAETSAEDACPSDVVLPSVSEVNRENMEEAVRTDTIVEVEALQAEKLALDAGEAALQEPLPEMEMNWQKDPRWMIGATLSPLYTFRDVESQAMSADYESGTVSYATGVQVGYRTTRRLAIESGVFYNKMGIDIGAPGIQLFSSELDFAPIGNGMDQSSIMAISNSVGNIVSNSGDIYVNNYKVNADYRTNSPTESWAGTAVSADQGIRQNLDYLEVPLNLRYTLVDRSIQVQLVGGMSTNLLVNNYVTMETADGSTEIGTLTNIRNVNYSGNAGVSLIYHFLDHFSLSLEPRFRYFLHSVNDATLPSTRPYTFGLYTGLNYLF
ncbi:MAG: outer membrane beta-barrel protein, partial [Bacteroidota bacterium]